MTRALEKALVAASEQLVRVPPQLTAPQRRSGGLRGKSDPIDALAIARAAQREPRLGRPRAGEERLRELRLLVDHRDDLVDERRRAQQRLRWHLHELDPLLGVPAGALDRPVWLGRVAGKLARRQQTLQVRIARDLVGRCRSLTRTILELERELAVITAQTAPALLDLPGCGAVTAAKLLAEIGPIERFQTDAQLARHGGVAPLEASSGRVRRATANSTARCTGSPSRKRASIPRHAPTSHANKLKARAAAKPSAASNDNSPASSSTP